MNSIERAQTGSLLCMLCTVGAFVLVNVYGPAISTEERAGERYAFKLRFYEVNSFAQHSVSGLGIRVGIRIKTLASMLASASRERAMMGTGVAFRPCTGETSVHAL